MLTLIVVLLGAYLLVAGAIIISHTSSKSHTNGKSVIKATCPKPRNTLSREEELLLKIRAIKQLTINGYYTKALSLLEEIDITISNSSNTNSNINITPVNSGELKE